MSGAGDVSGKRGVGPAGSEAATISRRGFLAGASVGAGVLMLNMSCLGPGGDNGPANGGSASGRARELVDPLVYGDWRDVHREKWTWDSIARCTHSRANCISACAWDVYVKDGICWREEQAPLYEAPRPDVPDANPRGCQKGACYTDLQASGSRVLHPLKRVGERGAGRWKRVSWEQALGEIADKLIDAALEQGSESIIYDHGTTNAGYGPETAGEIRFAEALQATMLDSWSGVGDMPMGCVQTWGMYNCEGTSDDWFRSDYIVVWIGNPAYTRIPDAHFMYEARYRGAKLVVISPDLNATAIRADLWLNPRPQSDAALGLAAAQVMVEESLYDADYMREQTDLPLLVREDNDRFLRESDLKRHGRDDLFYAWDEVSDGVIKVPGCQGHGGRTLSYGKARPALEGSHELRLADGSTVTVRTVFDRLRERLEEHTPEKTRTTTGIAPAVTRRFAREMAAAGSAMIFASWGACKLHHSDLMQRAMILLMALTGNQGKPGGGLRVAAWWGLDGLDRLGGTGLSLVETLRVIPRAIRGLAPRDYEDLFTQFSYKNANMPLMPFLYVHGGYREAWSDPAQVEKGLPRGMEAYLRESLDKGWFPMHPAEDRQPRAFIFTGSNPLRRWPAPQLAREGLWPKLDCVVSINFRMSTTSMWADYVLPAAGYYEKYGIKYAQSYVPYIITSDKAVEALGESKSEWEILGRLAEKVALRSKEREVGKVRGYRDKPLDLGDAYAFYTSKGRYKPHEKDDPVRLMDDIFSRSPSIGKPRARDVLKKGAVRIKGTARPTPIYQTSSDFDPNDTTWPHGWMASGKVAWPTITGRQQFYLDHQWYLEADEALPRHKDPPGTDSRFPLRVNGGHTRWSIHAIWRDHDLMLRLQRGEPVCFVSPVDCRPRGIADGDAVEVFNDHGAFEAMAKLSPSVQPGEVIIYHAWEPHQFKNWKGQQEPVLAPWKPLHLAGGYGHIHYRMFYGSPGHAPRGAPVDMRRA